MGMWERGALECPSGKVATCRTWGAGLWGLMEMEAAHGPSDGLPWKALPAGQEGADSGEERGLGPRGPRDPPPGMR